MDFEKHIKESWQSCLQFIGPVLVLTLVQLIISTISLGFLAPVMFAGYTDSLLRAQREGRVPEVKDLFSQFSLFLPLFIFGAIITIAIGFGFLFFVLPGVILGLLVSFACLYVVPLMVDKNLGLYDSVVGSWNMSMEKPVTDQLIIAVIYAGIISVGSSFFITLLFAMPLAVFFLLSVYEEKVDELGNFLEEE